MELGTLLNQNIKVVSEENNHIIKLINISNNMELARFESKEIIYAWGNPGGVMTKEEYNKIIARKELHEINLEMILNE